MPFVDFRASLPSIVKVVTYTIHSTTVASFDTLDFKHVYIAMLP